MGDDQSGNGSGGKTWLERIGQAFSAEPRDRDELLELLREAHDNEIIDADALGMIEGAVGVSQLHVRDAMIPRGQMVVVNRDSTARELLQTVVESGHSRFPVVGEDRDETQGILLAKDLLRVFVEGEDQFDINLLLRPATFIPESKRLNVLLREFRATRNHMAIVVDEYGGVSGLITIEDVLEEIVGEIDDEFDPESAEFIRKVAAERFTIRGLTPIDEFNAFFGTELSDEEFDTVGGLITGALGHVPERGETVDIEGMNFEVLRADNRRLELLGCDAPSP